jgi:hypothetical protein
MFHKTLKTVLLVAFVGIIVFMSSCKKRETQCDFYNSGELKLINYGENAGECYYLQNGKPVFLEKEHCAWYCN